MLLLDILPAFPSSLPPRQQIPSHRPLSHFPPTKTPHRCAFPFPFPHLRTAMLPPPVASFSTVEPLQHPETRDDAETGTSFEEEDYQMAEMNHFTMELDFSAERDTKHFPAPEVEVIQLEDLPDQWKRSRIAWLCKELPAHKQGTLVRILNAQRKWIRQADATYVAVHCMRIRENEAAYRPRLLPPSRRRHESCPVAALLDPAFPVEQNQRRRWISSPTPTPVTSATGFLPNADADAGFLPTQADIAPSSACQPYLPRPWPERRSSSPAMDLASER